MISGRTSGLFVLCAIMAGAFSPIENHPSAGNRAILGQFCKNASECDAPMTCASWSVSKGGCQGSWTYQTCEIPCTTNADCPASYSCSELQPTPVGKRETYCQPSIPKDGALHLMECDKVGCREGECISWQAPVRTGISCTNRLETFYTCELRCEPNSSDCPDAMECVYLSPGPGWHCRTREDYTPLKSLKFE
jgi:hypothetical protein